MSQVEDANGEPLIHVRSRWQYMRQRLKRRGVVEVGKSHPRYDMLAAMKLAIRKLFDEYPEARAKVGEELDTDAVEQIITLNVAAPSGKVYVFESYAPAVFGCVRAAVDIPDEDFLDSLSPELLPYMEFISNSRSGQDFYFTNNQRFVLKTDKQHCVEYFLSILREYLKHFQTYPHSLLVKFHGLYSIKSSGCKKRYFLVMQSIFYPTIRLEERFDIKGCLANRYQDPKPSGRKTILVLKDKNFLDEKIELGASKDWFLTQLRADVDFLQSIGVLDYSLLLGRHRVVRSERRESVGNLVLRVKRSFGHDKASLPKLPLDDNDDERTTSQVAFDPASPPTIPEDPENEINKGTGSTKDIEMQELSHNSSPTKSGKQHSSNTAKYHTTPKHQSASKGGSSRRTKKRDSSGKKVVFLRSLSDHSYLEGSGFVLKNRRLLLNCENNLHIIDGVNYRYYVGVIDFFTQFRLRQRVGKILKDLKTCCGNHSTEYPEVYAERFFQFVSERVV